MKIIILLISIVLVLVGCRKSLNSNYDKELKETSKVISKADKIIAESIESHGGILYDQAHYSFVFRGKRYFFKNNENTYKYSVRSEKEGVNIENVIENGVFKRFENNKEVQLSTKKMEAYSESLNSVIYFATLPYKLKDKAVKKRFVEEIIIKGVKYNAIEITFNKEGGGKDHEDVFYYWVNQRSKKVDYFAYSYKVNNGGIRFRSAFNSRVIGGITFQDYVNWKADLGTLLKDLPTLYEENKLIEVSRILTEDILNHKKQSVRN